MRLRVALKRNSKKKKKGKKTFFFAFFTFFTFQGRSYEVNLITVRSLKNLSSSPIVIFYVLDNNFLHTQLAFAFVRQKYFFNVHDDTDTFFLFFFFRKILIFRTFFWFLSFSCSEKFWFHLLLFGVILCVFDNII